MHSSHTQDTEWHLLIYGYAVIYLLLMGFSVLNTPASVPLPASCGCSRICWRLITYLRALYTLRFSIRIVSLWRLEGRTLLSSSLYSWCSAYTRSSPNRAVWVILDFTHLVYKTMLQIMKTWALNTSLCIPHLHVFTLLSLPPGTSR